MPDITTISAAVTTLKHAVDIAKLIKASDTSLEAAEVKLKMAELITALADLKMQLAEIQQITLDKDAEIKVLNESLAIKGETVFERPFYYLVKDDKKDGPFCATCKDVDDKFVRLQTEQNDYWICLSCKRGFKGPKYVRPPIPDSDDGGSSWVRGRR